MTDIVIPASFTLTRYRLALQALEPIKLSGMKSSALRGGFGRAFKRETCPNYSECKELKFCPVGNDCLYGYIFETSPPVGAEVLSNFDDVPHPFIIEATIDNKLEFRPGERLMFDLVLIGQANHYHQKFADAFQSLGEQEGLGKTYGKYRLLSMEAQYSLNQPQIMARAATLSTNQISLHFLTPTRLKHRGEWVNEGPPFEVLINKLLSRTSSLSYFHCGQRLEVDFSELIRQAVHIKTIRDRTRWENWARFSGRQNQYIEMGGLVGRINYTGELEPYLPLLVLGELIHVGKGTVFGNGQYQIVR